MGSTSVPEQPANHANLAHGDLTELLRVAGRVLEILEDDGVPFPLRYKARERAGGLRYVLRKWKPAGNGVSP